MLFSTVYVLISLLARSSCLVFPRDPNGISRGIVKLPITTIEKDFAVSKRQIAAQIQNSKGRTYEYLVTIWIGTPPQNMTVVFDTGSPDLWVVGDCKSVSCSASAQYWPQDSTTAHGLAKKGHREYGVSGEAEMLADYYMDNVVFAGAKVLNQTFMVAYETWGMDAGYIGVGLGASFYKNATVAPNIIDQMASQSVINSRAFSMDLGSVNSAEGSIIFGGIDTRKYTGKLGKFPMISSQDSPDGMPRYWLNMSSIDINKPGDAAKTPIFTGSQSIFLDSGATISHLPTVIWKSFVTATGATKTSNGQYSVSCQLMNQAGSVDFGFGNLTISVPYQQFFWMNSNGDCLLGVQEMDNTTKAYVLGDNFLRSAFVVYDQDNQNIHLAQAADCGTNLLVIGKGADAVPSVLGDCPPAPPFVAPTVASVASTARVASTAKPIVTSAPRPTTKPKTTSKVVVPVRSTKTTKKPGATGVADGDN